LQKKLPHPIEMGLIFKQLLKKSMLFVNIMIIFAPLFQKM